MFRKVKTLLADKKRWTKGTWQRNKYGHPVSEDCKSACKFCLEGALQHIYDDYERRNAEKRIEQAINDLFPGKFHSLISFNDNPETTYEDIKRVLQRANV